MRGVMATVAAACLTTGCATTEYIHPDCTVPPMPDPPEVTGEELAPLPDEVYWRVRERDAALVGAVRVRQAMLIEVCGD